MRLTTGCRLGTILLLAIIVAQAEPSDKAEQPTVKDCRKHVDAALRQYWDHPNEGGNPPVTSEASEDGADVEQHEGGDEEHKNGFPKDAAALRAAAATEDEGEQNDDDNDKEDEDSDDEQAKEEEYEQNLKEAEGDTKEHVVELQDEHDDDEDEEEQQGEDEDEAQETEEPTRDVTQDDEGSKDDDNIDEETGSKEEADTRYNGVGVSAHKTLGVPGNNDETDGENDDQNPDDDENDDEKHVKTVTKEIEVGNDDEDDDNENKDDNDEDEDDDDDDDDDTDDDEKSSKVLVIRTRKHIEEIMGMDDIGTEADQEELTLVQTILKDLKRNYDLAIKPLEVIYHFKDISTRVLGDAEIFSKPMVLFIGPWSGGKSSIINYLLGVERTSSALKSSPEPTDTQFTVVTYGEKSEMLSGTEMAADWSYSSVQKFGQGFLDHFRGIRMPHRLLQRVTFVDTPGIMESRKTSDKGYPFNDAFQWFIDRADIIYIVFDPTKLEIGAELEAIIDQLKGREAQIRFILNKADTIRRNDVMKVTGQLFWNLSPLLGSSEAPVIYSVSMMSKPFHSGSPARFLINQEKALLHDMRSTLDRRVENRISYSRRHAVRVRNHAKMVDCYLATYYRHKSIFKNNKKVAETITENPHEYSIYAGLSALTNVSRYDLPDPEVYKIFFRLNMLSDFKPLSATCTYFKGCPLDKLDISIAYDLPELLGKYKKQTKIQPMEWDDGR